MMKILVVSAHYPPNFVSGGTLVPQRLANEMSRRGHDVAVFAGWRGEDREPLDVQDEAADPGVRIRWVNSTPWLSDLDSRQYDNPEVERIFEEYCALVTPDVVHFHSIQGLGVGLIQAAKRLELPVIVSLHDFWWWCGRMFLCDRDYQPCCPVVDCGTCQCSVEPAWLASRNARLRAGLGMVDRVVAVSGVLTKVALANGLNRDQLVTIENGVEPSEVPRPAAQRDPIPGEAVRFLYAGGPDRMKGPHILASAVERMTIGGWTLDAYGWPEWAVIPPGYPVVTHDPFAPGSLRNVLDRCDVLVVPSVMRESYSVLTREAVSHGVPVITTDCLGPEEVIRDGHNGLVVPSADAAELSTAMQSLVRAPQLLTALRAGCATVSVPSVTEQADEYEKLYAELTSPQTDGSATPAPAPLIRRVLFVVGITGAPLRYRAYLPAEALESLGVGCDIRHYRHPDVDGLGARADLVVMYRVPATVQVLNFIAGMRQKGTPVVFDVDDLIFDPEARDEIPAVSILPADEAEQWMEGVRRYRATLDCCDAFVGSTELLVDQARSVTGIPSYRFGNGVGRILARLSDNECKRERSPGRLRIGYFSGTNTHDLDWRHIESAVGRVMDDDPDIELWLCGLIEPTWAMERHSARIRRRPMVPWVELPSILRDIDLNLAPLSPGSRFNDSKSAIKWLEAALVATPTVASPTQPYREVIEHGRNGMLAATPDEWHSAIRELTHDPSLIRDFGERSRRRALLDWGPHLQARRYMDILMQIRSNPIPPAVTDTWRSIGNDEPTAQFDIDRYEIPPDVEPVRVTMRRRIVDTGVTLQQDGCAAALRRVGHYGTQLLARRLRSAERRSAPR